METCGAHDLFCKTLSRVQDMQQKSGEEISENNIRTATIEIKLENLNDNFSGFREENERHQHALAERMDKLYNLVDRDKKRVQWRPTHFITLATGMLTSGCAVAVALIARGAKP